MNSKIEKAGPEHAEAIWNLRGVALRTQGAGHYDQKLLEAWAGGDMPDGFRDKVATMYIIREGERVVAYGMVRLESSQIDSVYVEPKCFGRGYGRRMVEHLQAMAQAHGITNLSLKASLNAVGFYRALGFSGDTPSKHYSPRGYIVDCVLMEKHLTPT